MTLSAPACGGDSTLEDLHLGGGVGGSVLQVGDRAATLGVLEGSEPQESRTCLLGGGSPWGHAVAPLPETPSPASPPLAGTATLWWALRGGGGGGRLARSPHRLPCLPYLRAAPPEPAARPARPATPPATALSGHCGRRARRRTRLPSPSAAPPPPRLPEHRGGLPRRRGLACWAAQDCCPRLQDQQAGASGG